MDAFSGENHQPLCQCYTRFAPVTPAIVAAMREELDIAIAFVDEELTYNTYIVGDDFTGADIMLAVSLLSFILKT
ncbi:glutathione binding-like protein [Coleofasciculus chthonoplastes]|nr:glutathione binding-like protein [Coleofasciculus chthonoplastes]